MEGLGSRCVCVCVCVCIQVGQRLSVPPWSCRSGLSALMLANNPSGLPDYKPFKMQLTERQTEKGDPLQIACLQDTTMEQVGYIKNSLPRTRTPACTRI